MKKAPPYAVPIRRNSETMRVTYSFSFHHNRHEADVKNYWVRLTTGGRRVDSTDGLDKLLKALRNA